MIARTHPLSPATAAALLATFIVAGPLRARGADPAADDFEHHVLGPNWIVYSTGSAIVNDSDLGVLTSSACAVGWIGSTFGADQFSQAEVSLDVDPDMLEQVYVRRRASDSARYGFHWNGDPGKSQWEIKYDGVPTAQTKILAVLQGPGPVPGDTLRVEVFATDPVVLRGYHNGALKLSAVDSSLQRITTTGPCGVVARMKQGTVNDPPTPIFENWAGGSLHWIDLGNGLAGSAGVPALSGTGTLAAGTPATLDVAGGPPGGTAILILGETTVNLALKGGVLVPSPDVVLLGIPLDANGVWSLPLLWPPELASGFAINAQAWIPDPGARQGLAASNGLRISTQ